MQFPGDKGPDKSAFDKFPPLTGLMVFNEPIIETRQFIRERNLDRCPFFEEGGLPSLFVLDHST